MDAAVIRIVVEADGSSVARGMSVATAGILNFERSASAALSKVKATFAGLTTGQKALTGIGTGFVLFSAGLKAAIGPAIQFESAFAGVTKTVEGTPEQLEGIRKGLLDLSTTIPTTAVELAGIAEAAGQLGVATPQVLDFTRVVSQLAETTNLDFDTAATSLARFINITGGAASVEELGDTLVFLGNNAATTESEILSLSLRLAGSFTQVGASEDQILGLAAAMTSLGINAESGGTAASEVITRMGDAVINAGPDLERFAEVSGVLPERFQEIFEADPSAALLLFAAGLNEITEAGQSITPVFEDLELNGRRVQDVLRRLGLDAEGAAELLEGAGIAIQGSGALADEAGKRYETTAARLEILQNRITGVAIAVGTPFLAGLAQGADVAGDAIARLVEIVSPLGSEIATAFGTAGSAAEGFYAAVGSPAVGVAVDSLGILVQVLGEALTAFNSLGPAGLILAALAADIALVGPVSVAAAAGLAAMRAGATGLTAAVVGGRAAMSAFALSINPVAAAAAVAGIAFFEMTREMREIQAAADEAGAAIEGDLNAALEAGDAQAFSAGIAETRTELDGLQTKLDGFDGFTKFDQGIAELLGNVSGVNEEFASTKAQIEALEDVLNNEAVVAYSANIERLGEQFGLTETEIIAAADASGDLSILFQSGLPAVEAQIAAMDAYQSGLRVVGDVSTETAVAFADGSANAEQYAEILGLSLGQLQTLTGFIAGVDFEDFFSEDPAIRADAFAAALAEVSGALDPISAELGLTTEAILNQVGATAQLAAAHSELRSAIEASRSALAAYGAQQAIAEESSAAFEEALEGVTDAASFEEAAAAARILITDIAGLGDAAAAADLQTVLVDQLYEAGIAAGLTSEETLTMIANLAQVDPGTLAALADKGLELTDAIAQANEQALILAQQELELQIGAEGAEEVIQQLTDAGVAANEIPTVIDLLMSAQGAEEVASVLADIGVSARDIPALVRLILEAQDNATPAIQAAREEGERLAALSPNVNLTATDNASPTIGSVAAAAGGYAIAYDASLTASDNGASGEIATQTGSANAYATNYDADLTASDNGASGQISTLANSANVYARTYNATLTATDNASNVISRAVAALTGFRSKTITITTRYRNFFVGATGGVTSGSSSGGGSSAFFAEGGFHRFDAGGLGRPPGAVLERPGGAKIYSAATPGRFFAEPVTGGEAYIPLAASNRPRSLAIWELTGRMLGVFANGGIQGRPVSSVGGQVIISPAITIQIDASGQRSVDEYEIGRIARREVMGALGDVALQVTNRRG